MLQCRQWRSTVESLFITTTAYHSLRYSAVTRNIARSFATADPLTCRRTKLGRWSNKKWLHVAETAIVAHARSCLMKRSKDSQCTDICHSYSARSSRLSRWRCQHLQLFSCALVRPACGSDSYRHWQLLSEVSRGGHREGFLRQQNSAVHCSTVPYEGAFVPQTSPIRVRYIYCGWTFFSVNYIISLTVDGNKFCANRTCTAQAAITLNEIQIKNDKSRRHKICT